MALAEDEVKAIVRRVVLRTLGQEPAGRAADGSRGAASGPARPAITEADVMAVPPGGRLTVASGAMVTPLARDAARDRGVVLDSVPGPAAIRETRPAAPGSRVVAIGADHGGYAMKEDLKAYLGELGYAVMDCGTGSTDAVDYPDFAYAVARLVADGRAWRGIVVDGAGIGSCMAANKVPGVRAAMCYDHTTAVNSREHNDANVLTLGGGLLGRALARDIVKTWLGTEFGGGRHARRVDKIMDIERRFVRH
jgi:ribose 5-phosphate isomerase B